MPRPEFNASLLGARRDAVLPEHRLVIELDGYDTHGHRAAFVADRRRDQQLAAAGYITFRVTWHDLTREPEALIARLAATPARSAAT